MVKVNLPDLSAQAMKDLDQWSAEVKRDATGARRTYAERVAYAKALFDRRAGSHASFVEIRSTLRNGSPNGRCMYCEHDSGNAIEHVAPKDLFPDKCFDWRNYTWACTVCNSLHKSSKWWVFKIPDSYIDVTRKRESTITRPFKGSDLFINPRNDDPLIFFELVIDYAQLNIDLVPRAGLGGFDLLRAKATLSILGLDKRADRKRSRYVAAEDYKRDLQEYVRRKLLGESLVMLQSEFRSLFANRSHRIVWEVMKASPHLKPLFDAAPEAFTW